MSWAIKHSSNSPLDGPRHYLDGAAGVAKPVELSGYDTMVFATRAAARDYIKQNYAYFKRPDLRAPPHCWKMPCAVRVKVSVKEIA